MNVGKTISCALIGDESLLVQCGTALRDRGHSVVAIITATDAVADWAKAQGIPVLPPDRDLERHVAAYDYDWFFSIANLRKVPEGVWRRAREGAANFHDGPLPRYAGLNTPAWAILAGETAYGVTWHALSNGIDEGEIYATSNIEISEDDTALSLNTKCFAAGIASFADLVDLIERGALQGQPQALAERTYFGKHARPEASATLNFGRTTAEVTRLARALTFGERYANPLALPKLKTGDGAYIALGVEAEALDAAQPAGTVISAAPDGAVIATADGAVRIGALRDALGRTLTPCKVLKAGDVLAPLADQEGEDLNALATDLAKQEAYFGARLKNARVPDIAGLVPVSERAPAFAAFPLAAPRTWDADVTMAAIVAFLARTAQGSRVTVGLVDDRLAADSAAFAGYLAPTLPLAFDFDADTALSAMQSAVRLEVQEARSRRGHASDLISRMPQLAPAAGTVVLRLAQAAEAAQPVAGSALTFVVAQTDGSVRLHVDTTRLPRDRAEMLVRQLHATFDAIASDAPPARVSDLPILSQDEVASLVLARNRSER